MNQRLKIFLLVVIICLLVWTIFFGWNCGMTCKGFCRCHGIPYGEEKCVGFKRYMCCVDCFTPIISSDECKAQGGEVRHYECPESKEILGTIYDVKDVDRICCR